MANAGQFEGMPSGSLTKMLWQDSHSCKGEHPPGNWWYQTPRQRWRTRGGGTVLASLSCYRRLWCVSEETPCCVAMPTTAPSLVTRTAMLLGRGLRSVGWCIDGRGKGTHIRWQGEQKIILYLNRIIEMNKKTF